MSDANFWEGPTSDIPVINADGNIFEEVQVAAGGETVFALISFEYTPNTHSIFVWKNGLMLRRGVDYTETSSTQVTMAAAAVLNDKYWFVSIALHQLIPPVVFNGMPSGGTTGQVLSKTSSSDYQANWTDPETAVSLLDAARINVASASTIDLSVIAATTRNIQITGSTQIDGFQVSNGQVWIVRFAAALVLKNNANIVTQSSQDIEISAGDTCIIRATADNVVEVVVYSRANQSIISQVNHNQFRLTLTTGVPVPTADVVTSTNLYLTPYQGNKISLFNGTSWIVRESAEVSLALGGMTANRPYDIFAYDNVGTVTLEILAWASATVRATALTTQDGVLVKSGDVTRKYLGTAYAVSATQFSDTEYRRLLWNYYNRVNRNLFRQEGAASWNYTNTAIRQANANAANQLEIIAGVQEDFIRILLTQCWSNSGAVATCEAVNYIGENGTAGAVSGSARGRSHNIGAGARGENTAQLSKLAPLGYNYYTWLESCTIAGTTTWLGTNDSGLMGEWRC